jgi:hypothetical protein
MAFSYVGNFPNQQVSNSGVLSLDDINNLESTGELGGTLELIEEQTVSSVTDVDFTSIKQNRYDVHFATWQFEKAVGRMDIRFYESGVLETGNVYQFSLVFYRGDGTFIDSNGTASKNILGPNTRNYTNYAANGYSYFYNLGDSTKYSFNTFQMTCMDTGDGFAGEFGNGVLPQQSKVDGIRLLMSGGSFDTGSVFSLYGIRSF